MRRLLLVLTPACLVIAIVIVQSTIFTVESQDNTEQRLTELEARVTLLEATVASISEVESSSESLAIRGAIVITSEEGAAWEPTTDNECVGRGNARALKAGLVVEIEDWEGEVVASTELGNGLATSSGCVFKFNVEVPDLEDYVITFANLRVTQSKSTLEENDWEIRIPVVV